MNKELENEILNLRTCGCADECSYEEKEEGWTTQCKQCLQLVEHLEVIIEKVKNDE